MKIADQTAKNPALAAASIAAIRAIGGGQRSNSGSATIVRPNSRFPGLAKSVELGGFALKVLGYKLVPGSEKTTQFFCSFRREMRTTGVRATYTNGSETFTVAAYVCCTCNFEIRVAKAA